MFKARFSLAFAVLLSVSGVVHAAGGKKEQEQVSDANVVQFVVDYNRYLTDRDLDALLKYVPDSGMIVSDRSQKVTQEFTQTRKGVAEQARATWEQYDPLEFSSGLALTRVTRNRDGVLLTCGFVDVVPYRGRHICSSGVLQFTLKKINGQTTLAKKEVLSASARWADLPDKAEAP